MNKVKVRALKRFPEPELGRQVSIGEVFEVSAEHAVELVEHRSRIAEYVDKSELPKEEKPKAKQKIDTTPPLKAKRPSKAGKSKKKSKKSKK